MGLFNFIINSVVFVELTLGASRTKLPILQYQVNDAKEAKAFVSLLKSIFDKNTGRVNRFQETELERFPLDPSRYVLKAISEETDDDSSSDSSESSNEVTDLDEPQKDNFLRVKLRFHRKHRKSDNEEDNESEESSKEKPVKKRHSKAKSRKPKKAEKKKKHVESGTEENESGVKKENSDLKEKKNHYESLSYMLRSCNTQAMKICKQACRRSTKYTCENYSCKKKMKKGLRKSCKKACKEHMKEDDSSEEDYF